ncbi:flagellar basal body rod protein FlgB [Bacillus testis]|uniref:flagellar basal body rod protein FlgB n=1 Tax=Bacillus testis TaxID=1622072 RepID=UPI00067F0E9C|nr:flagellar basal body rod protein FlgB [Bacillus testis]
MSIFSGTIAHLENALNYASTKQKVISDNLANADTPNFKAKSVSFKKMLDTEMDSFSTNKSDARHFDLSNDGQSMPGVYVKGNISYNNNGNSVDADKEMSDMAENQIYYNALIDRMNGKLKSLENVIRGGK